jgi:hypothetical protein
MRFGWMLLGALALGACFVDFDEFQFSPSVPPNTTSVGPGGSGSGAGTTGPGAGGPGGASAGGSSAGGSSSGGSSSGGGVASGVPDEVACGASACDVNAGEICCVPTSQMGAPFCHAGSMCPGSEAEMACDGPEDCNGNRDCCGVFSLFDGGYQSVDCQNNCDAQDEFILCTTQADCSNGGTCQSSAYLPPNVNTCF